MPKLNRLFIIKILILTLIISILSFAIFQFIFPTLYFSSFPLILSVFPIISIISYTQLLKASQKSPAKFNVAFMLSFMTKLIVYTAFAAILISHEKEQRISFVISIMLLYIIYTVFDTKSILNDMKKTE